MRSMPLQLAYDLPSIPGIPGFDSLRPKTYAPWPVWKDSTTQKVKFWPWLSKKEAGKVYAKALSFERHTRQPGKQDGALGRNGLKVLHTLLFGFLNYVTGRLDPAIETIARHAATSESSVKRGLANLKRCGVVHWVRRAGETRDGKGRFCEEQDTNAYGIVPPSQWCGFLDPLPTAPPPDPKTWGATPPLPSVIEQAAEELAAQPGAERTALAILESDPNEEQAAALASFGRTMQAMPDKAARTPPPVVSPQPAPPQASRPAPDLPQSAASWNPLAVIAEARKFGASYLQQRFRQEQPETSTNTDRSA